MDVSIIIPTCNRSLLLRETIESLTRLVYPSQRFEIVVVDNGSTDGTEQTVRELVHNCTAHTIRYLFEPVPGLLAGRHCGAAAATAGILVFIDDDVLVGERWLESIVSAFEDRSVHIVGGPSLPRYEHDPPAWVNMFWEKSDLGRWCIYLSLIDLGEDLREVDPRYIWGLNFAIRRASLFDLGGFHPDSVPAALQRFQGDGETGLSLRALRKGFKSIYHPGAAVRHWVPDDRMTPEYFERRAFFQGICDSYTAIRLGDTMSAGTSVSYLNRAMQRFRGVMGKFLSPPVSVAVDNDHTVMKNRLRQAHSAGYAFHQKEVENDPLLLGWVLKEDYWEYEYPVAM